MKKRIWIAALLCLCALLGFEIYRSNRMLSLDFEEVQVEALTGRPNCYVVTLSEITVTFAMDLYDTAGRLIDTIFPTAACWFRLRWCAVPWIRYVWKLLAIILGVTALLLAVGVVL